MNVIERLKLKGEKVRAVIYARFSSDNQRDESIDAQCRAIRDYAIKNDITIVHEYIDRSKSAVTDDRPEFLKMVSDASSKNFNIVLVHKLDRFARNRQDSIGYRMELKKHGVTLISVLEYLDDESPESIILESVLEAMAEYYSRNLAREVKKGMKENALKCMHTGGKPPLGYDVNPETKKYEINDHESLAVKNIFKLVLERKGYSDIIRFLNENGYSTKGGNLFAKNSLYEILRNQKYTGTYIFNRSSEKVNGKRNNHLNKDDGDMIKVPGGIPQIISEKDFEAVQEILNARQKVDIHKKGKEIYLLSGKIFCGECGKAYAGNRKFSGRNKLLHVTYRCNARKSKTSLGCTNKEIRREYIERFVLDKLADIIFDVNLVPKLIADYNRYVEENSADVKQHVEHLKKNLRNIEKQIDNITSAIAVSGSLSLVKSLEKLESEHSTAQSQIEAEMARIKKVEISEDDFKSAYEYARKLFKSGELKDIRQMINMYLDRVVIYKEHVEVYLNVLPLLMLMKLFPASKNVGFHGGGEGS